ncbi:TPA: hypothetical protein JIS15_04130 [Acinetobacter baumannii]|uniref:hypothetical protein n=1 Tax=Acinetobacter baumannii TaxID=470 RepID=UPI00332600AF|nr:hypothetical protein [Acinetobacter baumannii]
MDKNSKDWKEPKPLKWRSKNLGCDLIKCWTYKRNYMATTYDVDGDRYEYWIHEVSDKENPKLVLAMDDWDFPYDIQERCEQLLKAFAKGKMPGLNKNEKRLIEEGEGKFRPENINFIPFPEKA